MMDMLNLVINKLIEWIDKAFSFFGSYTSQYSKWLVVALLVFLVSKFFKLNIKI